MHVLVSCKNEEDPIKNEGAIVFTIFLRSLVFREFFKDSRAAYPAVHVQIKLNLELSPYFVVVLVNRKNKEDSIKNEGARVFTTLYIDFSDAQGQLTP